MRQASGFDFCSSPDFVSVPLSRRVGVRCFLISYVYATAKASSSLCDISQLRHSSNSFGFRYKYGNLSTDVIYIKVYSRPNLSFRAHSAEMIEIRFLKFRSISGSEVIRVFRRRRPSVLSKGKANDFIERKCVHDTSFVRFPYNVPSADNLYIIKLLQIPICGFGRE